MSRSNTPISIYNRGAKKTEEEKIYGEGIMRLFYESAAGRATLENIFTRPWFSKVYGAYKSTSYSAKAVPKFIKDFKIPMEEFEPTTYDSFNDFFIRKFKPGMRKFPKEKNALGAFAEGRYLAYQSASPDLSFPVKGVHLTATKLLGDPERAKIFEGGPLIISRLCPVDYHRFHYPDDGITVEAYPVHGNLHSVNPIALKYCPEIFIKNEREVSILKTENFGYLAYIEVGALCVGKIVQTHHIQESVKVGDHQNSPFKRGDEKGYFLFGGSTVVMLAEKDAFQIDADILEQTSFHRETYLKLGERIGVRS